MVANPAHLSLVAGTVISGSTASPKSAQGFLISAKDAAQVAEDLATNRMLKKLDPNHLLNLIATAAYKKGEIPRLKDVLDTLRRIEPNAGKVQPNDPERIKALQEQIKENEAAEKLLARRLHSRSGDMNPHSGIVERIQSETKAMEKAAAGMGFVMAALFAIGALSNFQNAKKKDENGQDKI